MEEEIKRLYIDKNLTKREIARILGIAHNKVVTVIQKLGLVKTKQQIQQSKSASILRKYGVDNVAKLQTSKEKRKQTCLERYGMDVNSTISKKEKCKSSIRNKYNVDNVMQISDVKQKQQNTIQRLYGVNNIQQNKEIHDKTIQTRIAKYGDTGLFGSKSFYRKAKETWLANYNVDNPMKSKEVVERFKQLHPDVIEKMLKTKDINKTHNTSNDEQYIKEILTNIFPDLKTQYHSELYPFRCDFYIPCLDLYIEYNGSWTHGGCLFEDNDFCNTQLTIWKEKAKTSNYYSNAITTWTIRDVNKYNIAQQNNLNWLCFYNLEQFNDWITQLWKKK